MGIVRSAPFFLLALLVPVLPVTAAAQAPRCTIAYVVGGDEVNCRGGVQVRLVLIDAPEQGPFGALARNALTALLPIGSSFRMELDERSRDDQGRVLAYLFLEDGRMVNEMMIRQGYAFFKPSKVNQRYAESLRQAESVAREKRLGVWAE
ncbi:MAG TPA: thermonuclease family protein [Gemmatimonadota bacterium]|nr:thermonuclease family protein [Gemmatimonadota bacterium]